MKKNVPIVSVIMPIYNGEKSCKRAINSVLQQTYKYIELIVINDGSKDGTLEIVQKYADTDSRIIVVNQPNSGVSVARNHGLEKCSGDYIVFIDSDDYMESEFVESLLKVILRDNSNIAMCGYNNLYSDGRKVQKNPFSGETMKDTLESIVSSNDINYLWNKMYRRELITHAFNIEKRMGEDLEFNVWYFLNVNSISIVENALYNYTVDSEGSLTKNEELLWDAIVSDWSNLNNLCNIGIDAEVINDKMLSHIFYFVQQQTSLLSVKHLLDRIDSNKSLKKLIVESNYRKIQYRLLRFLIDKHANLVLFLGANIKNKLKKSR
ncbi:MAG: glycosyltransferase [Butyrivibrio sp.]|nr:glycosyltransferase [Butyrivibrio sp.]